ncbi:hypothetical protein BIY23_00795 [Wolbachia pipientis]|uniref:Uncharacterized protein n=1 Tax=Wolbachia pipientis TaxID=955 RepID=A0A1E7QLC2_WOLPI|nr:hypothetical protein BIY23_00795 [Wolbachia pipientis]
MPDVKRSKSAKETLKYGCSFFKWLKCIVKNTAFAHLLRFGIPHFDTLQSPKKYQRKSKKLE